MLQNDPKRTFGSQAFCTEDIVNVDKATSQDRNGPLPGSWSDPLRCPVLGPMKRRSKAGGKTGKLGSRAASAPKRRRNAPKTALRRRSATTLETEIARLRRELREALEQQSSTSKVLQVISRSTFDLKPVLESLLERAVHLCDADRGLIYRQDGDVYRAAASYGHTAEWIETVVEQNPIRRDRSSATGRGRRGNGFASNSWSIH